MRSRTYDIPLRTRRQAQALLRGVTYLFSEYGKNVKMVKVPKGWNKLNEAERTLSLPKIHR